MLLCRISDCLEAEPIYETSSSENHALIRLTRALCPRRVRQFGRARTIDWILIRGPLASVGAELQDSVLASDHYPVSLTVVPKLGSTSLFRA